MDPPLLIVWQVSFFFPVCPAGVLCHSETSHTDFFFCSFPVDCPVWLMHHSVMLRLFVVHVSIIIFFQSYGVQFRVSKLVVRFPGRDTVVFAQKVSADPP